MSQVLFNLRVVWRRVSRLDVAAVIFVLLGAGLLVLERWMPVGGVSGFVKFLAILAAIYLVFRLIGWSRSRLLWSLRNRLIVAYLFIAVVPVLLLLSLAVLAGLILYGQLGAYLLYEDIHHRVDMLADGAEHIAAALETIPPGISEEAAERILSAQAHAVHDRDLPGMTIEFSGDATLLRKIAPPGRTDFAGLVQQGGKMYLTGLRIVRKQRDIRVVSLRVPVTAEFLDAIAPDLGPIQLNLLERFTGGQRKGIVVPSGGMEYETAGGISARSRKLQPAKWFVDPALNGVSKLDSVFVATDGRVELSRPVLAFFIARPSRLNARIFSSLGELSRLYLVAFGVVAVIFVLIEIAALITGIVLTRRITKAIGDLYQATQYVQARDLTHRVRIDRRDQLGVLGESFNLMTNSMSNFIEEQRQWQRLENEVAIAREVQAQLFPQKLPAVPGVEIEAICRAARVVSGDYYDFIQLSPTHLAMAIADISGKGISAALLMASLQAALRSQMLVPGSEHLSTAELVSRLNMHLVRNTADDRFATFFIAVYDSATRILRYTNAGHLPALCICNGSARQLDIGGMVLGVLEDYKYEEGTLAVEPGSLLIGYSDGLVEPENVYGEQFGIRRLEEAASRRMGMPPRVVAESLMTAADEWAGTPEQADDMTVIVARLG